MISSTAWRGQVIGPNIQAGETLQLLVPSNVWKMSRLLPSDLASPRSADEEEEKERKGCLITEVVFPGFAWEDHHFLDEDRLKKLWEGEEGWEEWVGFVRRG